MSVDLVGDKCAAATGPVPPSDSLARCMSSSSVCATTRQIDGTLKLFSCDLCACFWQECCVLWSNNTNDRVTTLPKTTADVHYPSQHNSLIHLLLVSQDGPKRGASAQPLCTERSLRRAFSG